MTLAGDFGGYRFPRADLFHPCKEEPEHLLAFLPVSRIWVLRLEWVKWLVHVGHTGSELHENSGMCDSKPVVFPEAIVPHAVSQ